MDRFTVANSDAENDRIKAINKLVTQVQVTAQSICENNLHTQFVADLLKYIIMGFYYSKQ